MTDQPRFGAALTCIDGRIMDLLVSHLRETWGVDHVDIVTLPGPESGAELGAPHVWSALGISVEHHGAREVAVVAHTDCAANPVAEPRRRRQIRSAVAVARDRLPGAAVTGWLVHTLEQHIEEVE